MAQADRSTCSGEYVLGGGLFRMGLSTCTLAACPPGSLDTRYIAALNAVTGFSMSGSELTLAYVRGVMRFNSQ